MCERFRKDQEKIGMTDKREWEQEIIGGRRKRNETQQRQVKNMGFEIRVEFQSQLHD